MPHTTLSLVKLVILAALVAGLLPASHARAKAPTTRAASALAESRPADPPEDPELEPRIIRLIAQTADPDAGVRDTADVTLRNLPVSAFPVIERVIGTVKDGLPPETAARLGRYRQMYARLAALEGERREQSRWIQRQLIRAYDDSPHRKPGWDADARQTVIMATQWARSDREEARLLEICRRARAAGADDPVFLYCAATVDQRHSDIRPRQVLLPMLHSALILGSERRSPAASFVFRCNAMAIAAMSPPDWDCVEVWAARNFSISFGWDSKEDPVPPALLYQLAWQILNPPPGKALIINESQRLLGSIRRMIPGSVYLTLLEAVSYRNAANDRFSCIENRPGHDPATSRRDEFLQLAEQLFDKARKMEPQNPMIAREMMLLYADTDRDDEADKCYRAAMAADPDDVVTASRRLDSLGETQAEFARDLLQQENWRGGLPFLLVEWHAERSRIAGNNIAYFVRPDVKADIQAVYEKYLRLFPKDGFRRSEYARYMTLCQMWPEADRQMQLLGEDWSPRVFGSRGAFEYARNKAAKMAAAPTSTSVPAPTGRAIP